MFKEGQQSHVLTHCFRNTTVITGHWCILQLSVWYRIGFKMCIWSVNALANLVIQLWWVSCVWSVNMRTCINTSFVLFPVSHWSTCIHRNDARRGRKHEEFGGGWPHCQVRTLCTSLFAADLLIVAIGYNLLHPLVVKACLWQPSSTFFRMHKCTMWDNVL